MKEALKRALEALELGDTVFYPQTSIAIAAIEKALAQPAQQEPVAWYVERQHVGFRDHGLKYGPFWKLSEAEELTDSCHILRDLYTTPPAAQPAQERNFCSRCGKRTADLTMIHTCTPPQENT